MILTFSLPQDSHCITGLIITLLLARYRVGLVDAPDAASALPPPASVSTIGKAAFPLLATVGLLIITRIPELGIKGLLQQTAPTLPAAIPGLGELQISAALVVRLTGIIDTGVNWQHALLYVPSLLPFVVVGILTLRWFKVSAVKRTAVENLERMKSPVFALIGALVFVNMMMLGGEQAPVAHIGAHLARLSGEHWAFFAPLLGALGSFFSGSETISNLTFGGIQYTIAGRLDLPATTTLALQSVGAAMGNMICINNIVAVTAILGISGQDGTILKRTSVVLLVFAVLAGSLGAFMAG